jgi:hypothetical protein
MVKQKELVFRICLGCNKDISNLPSDRVYCLDCFKRPGDE